MHGDPFTALGEEFLRTLGPPGRRGAQNADLTTRLAARTRQLERLSVRMVRQHEEERRRIRSSCTTRPRRRSRR